MKSLVIPIPIWPGKVKVTVKLLDLNPTDGDVSIGLIVQVWRLRLDLVPRLSWK